MIPFDVSLGALARLLWNAVLSSLAEWNQLRRETRWAHREYERALLDGDKERAAMWRVRWMERVKKMMGK